MSKNILYIILIIVIIIVVSFISYDLAGKNVAQAPTISENNQTQTSAEPGENFFKTGNLVKDNPGMEAGVWYLVYEAPGAPALQIKLQVDKAICDLGSQPIACEQALKQGRLVTITGEIENNVVIASKIHIEVIK
ncbi:MAG: hypothetical protein WC470_03325 [Candidatus Paceibacterota bacterium]